MVTSKSGTTDLHEEERKEGDYCSTSLADIMNTINRFLNFSNFHVFRPLLFQCFVIGFDYLSVNFCGFLTFWEIQKSKMAESRWLSF